VKNRIKAQNSFERSYMTIEWTKDVDAALADAKTNSKPVLVDFSAAPM